MTRRESVLFALGLVAFVSLGLPDAVLGVAWPSIRRDFALPLDRLGLLLVAATGGYLSASVLTAGLSWRWGYALIALVLALLGGGFLRTRGLWNDGVGAMASGRSAARLGLSLTRPGVWANVALFFATPAWRPWPGNGRTPSSPEAGARECERGFPRNKDVNCLGACDATRSPC